MNASDAWAKPVFLFCTGRSGSTLLLRYVNSLSNVTVWGEHAGIVTDLMEMTNRLTEPSIWRNIDRLRDAAQQLIKKEPLIAATKKRWTAEWANSFDIPDIEDAIRQLMFRLFTVGLPASRRWGFKEIRYGEEEVAFLQRLFPQARFILQIRDPEAVLRSQFKHFAKGDSTKLTSRFRNIVRYLEFVIEMLDKGIADKFYLSRYESLASNGVAEAQQLAAFLGEQLDVGTAGLIATERDSSAVLAENSEPLDKRLRTFAASVASELPEPMIKRCCQAYDSIIRSLQDRTRSANVAA